MKESKSKRRSGGGVEVKSPAGTPTEPNPAEEFPPEDVNVQMSVYALQKVNMKRGSGGGREECYVNKKEKRGREYVSSYWIKALAYKWCQDFITSPSCLSPYLPPSISLHVIHLYGIRVCYH